MAKREFESRTRHGKTLIDCVLMRILVCRAMGLHGAVDFFRLGDVMEQFQINPETAVMPLRFRVTRGSRVLLIGRT